jgi:uncharacterized protein
MVGFRAGFSYTPLAMRIILLFLLTTSLLSAQSSIPDMAALQKAAELGDSKAQLQLAQAYEDGNGLPKDDTLSIQWLRRAAEAENADAQNSLGVAFRMGRGVRKDYKEAVVWYRKGAKNGSANAMFNLGTVYYNGEGEYPNTEQALVWFLLAEKAGAEGATDAVKLLTEEMGTKRVQDSYIKVGEMYESGDDIRAQPEEAAKIYLRLSHYPPAQIQMARLYSLGSGVPADQTTAFQWCERAAKADYPAGLFCVAHRLHNGIGTPQNLRQAANLYDKAGLSGFPEGFYRLGLLHENGLVGKKNPKLALMYYFIASSKGVPFAQEAFAELAKKYPEKEVLEIKMKGYEYLNKSRAVVMWKR